MFRLIYLLFAVGVIAFIYFNEDKASELFFDGIKADKQAFIENATDDLKNLINNYIVNGADDFGIVNNDNKSLHMIWGGNLRNGLKLSEMRKYNDSGLTQSLISSGYKMVSITENPEAVLLVHRNGYKVGEYDGGRIALRNDLDFVYFDLSKNKVTKLGSVKGAELPQAIRTKVNSKSNVYYGDQASTEAQISFLKSLMKN